MKFTYDAYISLINSLRRNGYVFTDYFSYVNQPQCVIIRHDIDFSLENALLLSEREQKEGIPSFWFVLLKTNFYNIFTSENLRILRAIQKNGGKIGLHFDESQYTLKRNANEEYQRLLYTFIQKKRDLLGILLDTEINAVSMHRPSLDFLQKELEFPGIVNAYGKTFFSDFKYLSDSSRHWREDVEQIVEHRLYPRLQILTHAFWYQEKESTLKERLQQFCISAFGELYSQLDENFMGLEKVFRLEELYGKYSSS